MALASTQPQALRIGPDRFGRTIAIENGLVVAEAPADAVHLPCPDGDIAPGAVCAHTHLYSGLARYAMPPASPAPENFVQILERVWWRLDRALDADALAASARDYVARALLAGTTSLIDHHESPHLIEGSQQILADACEALGMRALLCYGVTERNFGTDEARRGLEECRKITPSPLCRGLVGLHASFTVSNDTIRAAGKLAEELGTVLHVHVAEDLADVTDAQARGFVGPLERLEQLGALPRGSIIAHGVHLNATQVRHAATQGWWLIHNPRSNEGNRVGYARQLGQSTLTALGCDGWDADMAVEEAALQRLAAEHGDVTPADQLANRAANGHALIAERFNTNPTPLKPGAVGDLVIRRNGAVQHVIVGGRIVVADGQLTGGDFSAIVTEGERQATRLWQRMADIA